jgi:hypothetical protein
MTGEYICELALGVVSVVEEDFACNNAGIMERGPQIVVTTSSANAVSIKGADVILILRNLEAKAATPIDIQGSNVTLVTEGTNRATTSTEASAALQCGGESNVTLMGRGTGSLVATGGKHSAGFGSGTNGACASIRIVNGSLTATGGTGIGSGRGSFVGVVLIEEGKIVATGTRGGAGIGTGYDRGVRSRIENITIKNGAITADGQNTGCGIGTGLAEQLGRSEIGSLTIENGSISAKTSTNSGWGSGIGSGRAINGNATIENLTIVNGSISAHSAHHGCGIGIGWASSSGRSAIGNLMIMNGTIEATSGNVGAGIGVCEGATYGIGEVINLTILDGNITATASSAGTGIGSGIVSTSAADNGIARIQNLDILNGRVNGTSTDRGAGIGTGMAENGLTTIDRLTIVNGHLTGKSTSYGSGIGTSQATASGTTSIGNLTILNGNITAESSSCGSGIGTAYGQLGLSAIDRITIANGNITARSSLNGSGIGTAEGVSGRSWIGSLDVIGGNITATSSSYGSGIGTGYGRGANASRIESVTIYNGNITAKSSSYGSGIGTGRGQQGSSEIGKLIISNGTITASSTSEGSGIGTGSGRYGTSKIGSLVIGNATVTATSSHHGSAIGTGKGDWQGISEIESITIMCSTISAIVSTNNGYGSGVGTGYGYYGESKIQVITIMNSTLTTRSSQYGSGIGTGWGDHGKSTIGSLFMIDVIIDTDAGNIGSGIGTCEGASGGVAEIVNLTITRATITAKGSAIGPAIGAGLVYTASDARGLSRIDNLSIINSTVTATATNGGAAIGTSQARAGESKIDNLIILGGHITAIALPNAYSPGIGSSWGQEYNGKSVIGNLTILRAVVVANSSHNGAGIGTGYSNGNTGGSGESSVGNLRIVNATVTATSTSNGAGIGTGIRANSATSKIDTIFIADSTVDATGTTAGIGTSATGCEVSKLKLFGHCDLVCRSGTSSKPVTASSIAFADASLVFVTQANQLFSQSPTKVGQFDLVILYETTTSSGVEPLGGLSAYFLHVLNLTLPENNPWQLCVSREVIERCIGPVNSSIKSLILSVSYLSTNYEILASGSSMYGYLAHGSRNPIFLGNAPVLPFPIVVFVPFASRTKDFARSASLIQSLPFLSAFIIPSDLKMSLTLQSAVIKASNPEGSSRIFSRSAVYRASQLGIHYSNDLPLSDVIEVSHFLIKSDAFQYSKTLIVTAVVAFQHSHHFTVSKPLPPSFALLSSDECPSSGGFLNSRVCLASHFVHYSDEVGQSECGQVSLFFMKSDVFRYSETLIETLVFRYSATLIETVIIIFQKSHYFAVSTAYPSSVEFAVSVQSPFSFEFFNSDIYLASHFGIPHSNRLVHSNKLSASDFEIIWTLFVKSHIFQHSSILLVTALIPFDNSVHFTGSGVSSSSSDFSFSEKGQFSLGFSNSNVSVASHGAIPCSLALSLSKIDQISTLVTESDLFRHSEAWTVTAFVAFHHSHHLPLSIHWVSDAFPQTKELNRTIQNEGTSFLTYSMIHEKSVYVASHLPNQSVVLVITEIPHSFGLSESSTAVVSVIRPHSIPPEDPSEIQASINFDESDSMRTSPKIGHSATLVRSFHHESSATLVQGSSGFHSYPVVISLCPLHSDVYDSSDHVNKSPEYRFSDFLTVSKSVYSDRFSASLLLSDSSSISISPDFGTSFLFDRSLVFPAVSSRFSHSQTLFVTFVSYRSLMFSPISYIPLDSKVLLGTNIPPTFQLNSVRFRFSKRFKMTQRGKPSERFGRSKKFGQSLFSGSLFFFVSFRRAV